MKKNPYEMTFEEFEHFMGGLKQVVYKNKRSIIHHKKFSTKEEYMKYYGAITLKEYLKKREKKFGL